ncbi:hypothetical protein SAMD00023353_0802350 [Rosellinia necatrix]|uniref:Uncharacterized protein n=1 Tax=Rosellinia necatrix TaxID=77044 RepID=A0A1S8A6L5_ROSNE|nr:hypothetical protein SAMD00023353_0802350 [Rosellinia necatrix]
MFQRRVRYWLYFPQAYKETGLKGPKMFSLFNTDFKPAEVGVLVVANIRLDVNMTSVFELLRSSHSPSSNADAHM